MVDMPGRDDERAAGGLHDAEELGVGQRRRGGLVARRLEALHELDRRLVPARREPHDAAVAAMAVDGLELLSAELDLALVLDIGHSPPGRIALDLPLIARHAQLRGALLELDGIAAGERGAIDELPGEIERPVVVDADLGDHEHRLAGSDDRGTNANQGKGHDESPCGGHQTVNPPSTTRLAPVM
jgi:hypothetical protein